MNYNSTEESSHGVLLTFGLDYTEESQGNFQSI